MISNCSPFASTGVYPRTHGETNCFSVTPPPFLGLSPYTRGNHIRFDYCGVRYGSIPVHTGKPWALLRRRIRLRVYPRTHGETLNIYASIYLLNGLSPYTRGNLTRSARSLLRTRSIPVHTGKPNAIRAYGGRCRVYPRTHGETRAPHLRAILCQGLSPYTRGNPKNPYTSQHPYGSIPVHTGKPFQRFVYYYSERVYPRTHGETPSGVCVVTLLFGLSPYTRGNPLHTLHLLLHRRSIPVHTGKPIAVRPGQGLKGVYPRTHGETCTNVYFIIPRKMDGESSNYFYSLFTNRTPSASRISLGGSPR